MTTETFVQSVHDALAPMAEAERAMGMRAYMREQFDFLGISAVARRQATALLIRAKRPPEALFKSASQLWALPQREYLYIALDLLGRHRKSLSLMHIDDLLSLAQKRAWWDTVDALADVVGDIIRAARKSEPEAQHLMDAALKHEDKWVRRIAMLYQLGWRGETDTARLFGYALKLAPETDFFIRKAIGWALRDYARHDPQAVGEFLALNRNRLSPLSIREAAKRL